MSIQLVIAEKPSVARSIAGVIGADQKKDGYQSFEGSRTSDNDTFQATYNASVTGFNGQDILVADTDLKENECREIVIQYQFDSLDGKCQLIYISPDLEEQVLSESSSGSVAVQLQVGANYIGITGTDYSGTIQITVE